ncbi:hypothetical protein AO262_22830 [Pseudomonas fluorescens ABAC62]|nr:hypothetical protein AO262_22830 [Pseudomonas fluorescens ABAC62]
MRLLASPSTCIQFAPGSEDFKVSEQAPGYRWLRLHGDGRLETGVERVRHRRQATHTLDLRCSLD